MRGSRFRHLRRRPPTTPPPVKTTLTLEALGLHRVTRQAVRDLQDRVDQLESLIGLLDSVTSDVLPGDEPDQLRAATTMMKAALKEIVSTSIEAGAAIGQVRLVAALRALEIEDGPPQ